jgi:uncharacterized membrane protein
MQNSSKSTVLIPSVFILIFIAIGVVNQYAIRTFFDLGMINQALYQITHHQTPLFTLGIDGINMPFLATHFSPIIYLYLPLYWIFGPYTPTFIQISVILLAGIPIFKYAQIVFQNNLKKSNLILIHFYLLWGIYGALSFDFHNNVIGAMLVPWVFLFLKKKQFGWLLISSILMIISMETFGIWLFFIIISYSLWQLKNKQSVDKKVFVIAIAALIYSILIIVWVMPLLQNSTQNLQIGRYQHLGNSISEIILNLVKNPLIVLKSFYVNFNDGTIAWNKLIFWVFLILSAGFLVIKNPILTLLFIPPLVFKLLSKDTAFYGIYHQYSIEFIPLLSLIFIEGIHKIKSINHQKLLVSTLVLTAICTFLMINFSLAEYDYKENSKFYSSKHFDPEIDVQQIQKDLKLIPEGVIVSASNCLSPHLYQRTFLYCFPVIKNAEYLAIIKNKRSPWPLTDEEHTQKIQELSNSGRFQILKEDEDLIILKKR